MTSTQQFSPLCDVHHVSMRHVMLEQDSEEVRNFHACQRHDCTRVFDSNGYSDRTEGEFDDVRASVHRCPRCRSALYLAEVEQLKKIETWECSQADCDYSEESRTPSGR
jgi:hypothetical protein